MSNPNLVPVILAAAIAFVMVGTVIGAVIVQPEDDQLIELLAADLMELSRLILASLLGVAVGRASRE